MGKNPVSAALAIDGDPQTGWSRERARGRGAARRFSICAAPLDATRRVDAEAALWPALRLLARALPHLGDHRFRARRWRAICRTKSSACSHVPEATAHGRSNARIARTFSAHRARTRRQPRRRSTSCANRCRLPPTTLVFRERPPENPRPTFIHHRGEFLQPKERVEPAVFSFLPPLRDGEAATGWRFARWLVSPENPLTARVTVNRQWAAFFGRGLVRTTEDFGYQGEPPTHPELLDWLAVEFVKQGWSLKKLHRLIVTSATYRQSSRVDAGAARARRGKSAARPRSARPARGRDDPRLRAAARRAALAERSAARASSRRSRKA